MGGTWLSRQKTGSESTVVNFYHRFLLLTALCGALSSMAPAASQAANMDKFVALGTGSVSGVFYPVGLGICKLVNAERLESRVRCKTYETGGSVYNIEAIRSRELDLGITRSDLAALTYQGKTASTNETGAAKELRAIANLYAMPVGIIVKKKAKIKSLDDIIGKRLNFGNRGSGKRTVIELLFKYKKWEPKNFPVLTELPTKEMGEAFCADKLDVLLEILGHPATFYQDMIQKCDGELLSLSPEEIKDLTKLLPFSEKQKIPASLYPDTPKDIQTFGFQAVMITSNKVHEKTIFNVVESMFKNLKKFRNIHPALSTADPDKMIRGLVIPMHKGAKQYYKTNGYKSK